MGLTPELQVLDRLLARINRRRAQRIHLPSDPFRCADCAETVETHGHSVITHDGGSRQYCDPCYRARAKWGYEFDARTWDQIEAQADADGDAPRGGEAVAYARDLALREK